MDAKIKRLWVKALRSGKYKQANGTLRAKNGAMCCLGELCEIQGLDWRAAMYNMTFVTSNIPRRLNAGLQKKQRDRLANMNDGALKLKRHSFSEIADYIAKNL